MYNTSRPDIRVSRMVRRLPPDVADDIAEEIAEYIEAWEHGRMNRTSNTVIGRYRSMNNHLR